MTLFHYLWHNFEVIDFWIFNDKIVGTQKDCCGGSFGWLYFHSIGRDAFSDEQSFCHSVAARTLLGLHSREVYTDWLLASLSVQSYKRSHLWMAPSMSCEDANNYLKTLWKLIVQHSSSEFLQCTVCPLHLLLESEWLSAVTTGSPMVLTIDVPQLFWQ